ncbi:hypothetical protein QEN19_000460 [Hanseniaspora menglaensis]
MGNSPSRPNEYLNNNHMGQSSHSLISDEDNNNNNGLDDPDDSRKKQINKKINNNKKKTTFIEKEHQQSNRKDNNVLSDDEKEQFDFDMEVEIAKAFTNDSKTTGRRSSKISNSSTSSKPVVSDKKRADSSTTTGSNGSFSANSFSASAYSSPFDSSPPTNKLVNSAVLIQSTNFEKVRSLSGNNPPLITVNGSETSEYKLNFATLSDSNQLQPSQNKKDTNIKKKSLTLENKAVHDSLQPPIKRTPTPLASLATGSTVSSGSTTANNVIHETKGKFSDIRNSNINLISQPSKLSKNSNKMLNIDDCIARLREISEKNVYHKNFPFEKWEIQLICSKAREVFLSQPSLLNLKAPIKVVGDVHGQFNDLLRILKLSGDPSKTGYLFLGDYVDRGKQSLETILLLLLYKIKFPQTFFMLRGNHESSQVTKIYGFYDECKRRCGTSKVWKYFVDCFNCLPFAGIINDKIFCVHGGISPYLQDIKQIEKILRPTDIPQEGLLTDLLWSDPEKNLLDWQPNSDRGVSCYFSKKNVSQFCKKFQFELIIRGHMVVEDGYEFFGKKRLVTIFSAPNYCGEFNNWGAVMDVDKDLMCSFELLKPRRTDKQ